MGDPRGFMKLDRETPTPRPVEDRLQDYREIYQPFPTESVTAQASRCMDCGVPFCHTGCPLGNLIPDWNDLVYRKRWAEAVVELHSTNNFPEFTGRVCPAPCEASCVLAINAPAVTIKNIELSIVEKGFEKGYIKPQPPPTETGKRVAVIGSGPAGLAAAQQLRRAGHKVTVYERDDRLGGLLVYGIPDFKMEKFTIDRRLEQMRAEGVEFVVNAHVGVNVDAQELRKEFDAVLITVGATAARDLKVPGRELDGIHFAMEYLPQQNRRGFGDRITERELLATDKHVIIIGGGDTGADCLGTAHRHRARSVTQLELLPRPPEKKNPSTPWPAWPLILRKSSAHEEGGDRDWAVSTKKFVGENGKVKELHAVRVNWVSHQGRPQMEEIPGSEVVLKADMVLLAMGFVGPEKTLPQQFGLKLDERGNIACDRRYMSSVDGVFAAGDCRRGQSLVVWAIAEGREAARQMDAWLMGRPSPLHARDASLLTAGEGLLPILNNRR